VQALCDRVLIINKGKLVLDATADQLSHSGAGSLNIVVKTDLPGEDVAAVLRTRSILEMFGEEERRDGNAAARGQRQRGNQGTSV